MSVMSVEDYTYETVLAFASSSSDAIQLYHLQKTMPSPLHSIHQLSFSVPVFEHEARVEFFVTFDDDNSE